MIPCQVFVPIQNVFQSLTVACHRRNHSLGTIHPKSYHRPSPPLQSGIYNESNMSEAATGRLNAAPLRGSFAPAPQLLVCGSCALANQPHGCLVASARVSWRVVACISVGHSPISESGNH